MHISSLWANVVECQVEATFSIEKKKSPLPIDKMDLRYLRLVCCSWKTCLPIWSENKHVSRGALQRKQEEGCLPASPENNFPPVQPGVAWQGALHSLMSLLPGSPKSLPPFNLPPSSPSSPPYALVSITADLAGSSPQHNSRACRPRPHGIRQCS